ncbi:MAG: ECF-type sigma factor [Thermoanaerobaculia bacterium]|nr:ECF-type sigma factor [Thermoanaerobaculia bacterium]
MIPSVGMEAEGEVTGWLHRLAQGDGDAFDRLVPLLYDEMRRIASENLRGERREHTLGTTALVHEAYLRLLAGGKIGARDRTQFFGAASRTMRRILVDYARARKSLKRGGGLLTVPLDEAQRLLTHHQASEILAIDEALDRLSRMNDRAARVVHLRFFGGLNTEEIAAVLEISVRSVHRAWVTGRAWLRKEVAADLGIALTDPTTSPRQE